MNAASRSVTATSAKKACLASARRVAATRVVRTSAKATSTITFGKDLQNKLALASKTVGAQLLLALPALGQAPLPRLPSVDAISALVEAARVARDISSMARWTVPT